VYATAGEAGLLQGAPKIPILILILILILLLLLLLLLLSAR
jgi:hypothetical protein